MSSVELTRESKGLHRTRYGLGLTKKGRKKEKKGVRCRSLYTTNRPSGSHTGSPSRGTKSRYTNRRIPKREKREKCGGALQVERIVTILRVRDVGRHYLTTSSCRVDRKGGGKKEEGGERTDQSLQLRSSSRASFQILSPVPKETYKR